MDDADAVLDREIAEIKEAVDALEHDIDALLEHERDNAARDAVIDLLKRKQEHAELLQDEEHVEHLLDHLEQAYRTAAVSEDTYQRVKQANKELLR